MYPSGQSYVSRDEVVGLVYGYIPYLGWFTIALVDYPWVKIMAFLAVAMKALLD
jgi:signal peptidase